MPTSDLYATQTPTPYKVPISDGSGTLNDWITALVNPMTTDQDIIVGGVGGTPGRLAVGLVGYVLTVGSGGIIDWEPSSGGFVNPMTTSQDLIIGGLAGAPGRLGVGSVGQVLTVGSGGIVDWENPAASGGTVTTVSVVSANGFAGTVATATTTPAITLTTTITGILSGNGTAISAASTTGSGAVVLANTPTLITPVIGAATGTSLVLSAGLTSGAVAGVTGTVLLKGLTSGTVTLSVADAAGTNTFKLPATAGSNTNVLATDGSGNLFWQTAGTGTGTVNSGTATNFAYYATTGTAVSGTGTVAVSSTGRLTFTPTAITSGSTSYLTIVTPSDTTLAAGTESKGINVTFGTRQFASNTTVANQREIYIAQPTYSFASATGTVQIASTVWIEGQPAVGTNAVFTAKYAMYINTGDLNLQAGGLAFAGNIAQSSITCASNLVTINSVGGMNISPSNASGGIFSVAGTAQDMVLSDSTSTRSWQGVSAAGQGFYVQRSAANVTMKMLALNTTAQATLEGAVAVGTYGSVTATDSGALTQYILRTWGGSTWAAPGIIRMTTTQAQSQTARGCKIELFTTPNSSTTAAVALLLDQDASATFASGVKTGAPSGGTAAFWKHGVLVTAAVVPDTTRYIQLDVGGTLYKLIVST